MIQRRIFVLLLSVLTVFTFCVTVYSHPGRTDSSGGHRDSPTGEYHYHHGYPSHDHYDMDGDGYVDCPYNFDDKANHAEGHSKQAVPEKKDNRFSFWGLASALFSSIVPAFGISLLISLILVNIIFLIFGDDIGWTITKIAFFLIFAVVCYQLVAWELA